MKKAQNKVLGRLKERQKRASITVFLACSALNLLKDSRAVHDALELYEDPVQISKKRLDYLREHDIPGDLVRLILLNYEESGSNKFPVNTFLNKLIYTSDKAYYSKLWGVPRDSLLLMTPKFKPPQIIKRSYVTSGKNNVPSHIPPSVDIATIQNRGKEICALIQQPLKKAKAKFYCFFKHAYDEVDNIGQSIKDLARTFFDHVVSIAQENSRLLPESEREGFIKEIVFGEVVQSTFQHCAMSYVNEVIELLTVAVRHCNKYVPAIDKHIENLVQLFEHFNYDFSEMAKRLYDKGKVNQSYRIWLTDFVQPFIDMSVDPSDYLSSDLFGMTPQKLIDIMEEYIVSDSKTVENSNKIYFDMTPELEGILEFYESTNIKKVLLKLKAPKKFTLKSQVNSFRALLQLRYNSKMTTEIFAQNNKVPHSTVKHWLRRFNKQLSEEDRAVSMYMTLIKLGILYADQITPEVGKKLMERGINPVDAINLIRIPTEQEDIECGNKQQKKINSWKKRHANTSSGSSNSQEVERAPQSNKTRLRNNSKHSEDHKNEISIEEGGMTQIRKMISGLPLESAKEKLDEIKKQIIDKGISSGLAETIHRSLQEYITESKEH